MKTKNLSLILIVIALVAALMAAIYISGASSAFNGVVDTVFADIAGIFSHSGKEDGTESRSAAPVAKTESSSKKKASKDAYEITNNGYTLASIGKTRWLYESSWPFVTEPVLCDGIVLSVTAEPAFMVFSADNGALLKKEDCPIYPGESAYFENNILMLSGRDGNTYQFRMNADYSFTDIHSEKVEEQGGYFLSLFEPDKKTADFITSRIKTWSADENRVLPDIKLYTGHINEEGNGNFWAQQTEGETTMFVFTPDKQGMYQIGLADENGAWITANAFVAVFGEGGDLKQVSLDYVANKPLIKQQLSDSEIYYIVAGWAKDMYDGTETWLQIAESR